MNWQPLPWQIRWARTALTGLQRLPIQQQRRIAAALERYATSGYGDIVRVVGTEDQLRLRVGDWRVRFRSWREPDDRAGSPGETAERRIIEVLLVRHRNAAYRDL
jgi:mRNA interferase RelE/StbE